LLAYSNTFASTVTLTVYLFSFVVGLTLERSPERLFVVEVDLRLAHVPDGQRESRRLDLAFEPQRSRQSLRRQLPHTLALCARAAAELRQYGRVDIESRSHDD
jgi:hypothetical protein